MSKACLVILYTFIPPLVSFKKSLHCSLSVHSSFASPSFGDLALHTFLTVSTHVVQSLSKARLLSSSDSCTLIHQLNISQPLQNLPIHSISHLFSHTKSAPYYFIHHLIIYPGRSTKVCRHGFNLHNMDDGACVSPSSSYSESPLHTSQHFSIQHPIHIKT